MALQNFFQVGPVHGPACWLVMPKPVTVSDAADEYHEMKTVFRSACTNSG